ncbi:MAG: hypothetical protein J6B09_02920 [Clostridia bacterium]|nr:hypothetical protein [Clostridia bacterium]MBQ8716687.1 hypothetical protein [Clostridia bacterium]
MSKEAILHIREAEDQAAVLCRVAEEKAAELRERVKAQGQAHCAAVRENTEAEYAAVLADMRRRALALEEKKRLEALEEADALKEAARERIDEAIRLIVWEIVEKCQ